MKKSKDRITDLFTSIVKQTESIGATSYQTTVESIYNSLRDNGNSIPTNTIYRYLRDATQDELIKKKTKTVKVYSPINVTFPRKGEIPNFLITNEDGEEIPPEKFKEFQFLAESGEKTLTSFEITEKGNELLKKIKEEENE